MVLRRILFGEDPRKVCRGESNDVFYRYGNYSNNLSFSTERYEGDRESFEGERFNRRGERYGSLNCLGIVSPECASGINRLLGESGTGSRIYIRRAAEVSLIFGSILVWRR